MNTNASGLENNSIVFPQPKKTLPPILNVLFKGFNSPKVSSNSKSPWDDELRRKYIVLFIELPLVCLITLALVAFYLR